MSVEITSPPPWRDTYRRLIGSLGEYGSALNRSLLGLLAAAALQGLTFACVLPLSVAVFTTHDRDAAVTWLVAMTALALLSSAVKWWALRYDYMGNSVRATHVLRLRLGEQLRRMPLEKLVDKRSGEIHAALLGNVDEQIMYVTLVMDLVFSALVAPLVVAFATLFFDVRLGLLLLVLFPAIFGLYRWRRPTFDAKFTAVAEAHERINGDAVEYTQGLALLRAARADGERSKQLQAGFERLRSVQTQHQRTSARPAIVIASVVELGLLLVVALGVAFVVGGSLDVAVLAATVVLVARFAVPLASLVSYTSVISLIEAALVRIEALLAIEELPVQGRPTAPERFDARVENVTFQYAGTEQPVLRELSAELPARSMTALVGPSGSGKTTLTRLLMRHADPQAGRILIGGVDIRSIPAEELHTLISVVFQDVYLFDDTVRANIRMARPEASDAEVEAAARDAQCLDVIERLPKGWDTRLGEIGGRLSSGERQRISIARALLKNAPIVILDEPTASLDTESECAVQRAVDTLVRDKTVVAISHRLSTIAGADRILVLEEGRVVQQGTHDELIREGGRYGAMWAAQERVKAWHVGDPALAQEGSGA